MLPSAIQNKTESNPSVLSFGRVWIASILLSLTYFLVGYNRFLFIFANTTVAVTIAALIFTNVKIFKYLRLRVHQWESFHDSTEENLAKKQAVKWEKKIATVTFLLVLIIF